jgi:rhodanese-related sulfurtransferase
MERLIEYAGNHPWLVAAAVLAAVLVVVFEIRARQDSFAASPQDLIRFMNQGALVLDLRRAEDYEAGHIGNARQMDSAEILKAGETLRKHREKNVVVYCGSGSVGASAARSLTGQGFTKVFNLRGGIAAWRAENLPLSRAKEKARA